MKLALVLITLLWTAFSFASDFTSEDTQKSEAAAMELYEERVHTIIANSTELRRMTTVGREVAASSPNLIEFDQLMQESNQKDYLKASMEL